ncbi:unnamed protein product [Ceratitis capitata]|uniref:(Mediterranean fruit fly) hypothetical protein n=1 Tax=Ceratitis capitata TaxID=7213 RepID=A0A811VEP1_CERCA|nr:unnamed protein product [Ceratitis capitata]
MEPSKLVIDFNTLVTGEQLLLSFTAIVMESSSCSKGRQQSVTQKTMQSKLMRSHHQSVRVDEASGTVGNRNIAVSHIPFVINQKLIPPTAIRCFQVTFDTPYFDVTKDFAIREEVIMKRKT